MADHPLLGLQWQISMLGLAHNHDVSREQLNTADALRQCELHEPSPRAHIVHFIDGIDMPRAHTGVHIIDAGGSTRTTWRTSRSPTGRTSAMSAGGASSPVAWTKCTPAAARAAATSVPSGPRNCAISPPSNDAANRSLPATPPARDHGNRQATAAWSWCAQRQGGSSCRLPIEERRAGGDARQCQRHPPFPDSSRC